MKQKISNARGVSKRTPASNQAGGPAKAGARSKPSYEELAIAALQSHYAILLNRHDGGKRMAFDSSEEWIERLHKTSSFMRQLDLRTSAKSAVKK